MARVVMFVLNDCRNDARVLREAATLAAAGHAVTIVARTSDPYAPAGEVELRGDVEIRRVPVAAGGLRWLLLARRPARFLRELAGAARRRARTGVPGVAELAGLGILGIVLALPAAVVALVLGLLLGAGRRLPPGRAAWLAIEWRVQWRFGVMPWTRAAIEAAPDGEVFHAHDLRALPAANGARDRRGGSVVYDSHEIFVEAGANARRPGPARAALLRLERQLASGVAALVTVNDDLATVLGERLGLADRTVVVRNCPPRWDPPAADPGPLRASAGVPAGVPLLLSHGTFVPHRGFEQLAAALALPQLAGVHAACLGYGPLRGELERLAASPALAGRLHVLDAVPPDDLPAWVHGADIDVVAIQPSSLNHRLSTPNKLFESLAAGVPVVASDFPPMRRIVIDDPDGPLGAVCDPADPASLAAAIRSLLDLPPGEASALRRRCLEAAHARYAWEIEGARLLELYARLAGPPVAGVPVTSGSR